MIEYWTAASALATMVSSMVILITAYFVYHQLAEMQKARTLDTALAVLKELQDERAYGRKPQQRDLSRGPAG